MRWELEIRGINKGFKKTLKCLKVSLRFLPKASPFDQSNLSRDWSRLFFVNPS